MSTLAVQKLFKTKIVIANSFDYPMVVLFSANKHGTSTRNPDQ